MSLSEVCIDDLSGHLPKAHPDGQDEEGKVTGEDGGVRGEEPSARGQGDHQHGDELSEGTREGGALPMAGLSNGQDTGGYIDEEEEGEDDVDGRIRDGKGMKTGGGGEVSGELLAKGMTPDLRSIDTGEDD